jgi:flagella basal body P-ring formation protein FlgA
LEDGAMGQAIAVMNLQSKRTVQGEVMAGDLVMVALRHNLIADRLQGERKP